MEEYNLKGTYEPQSLDEVVGEVELLSKTISTEGNLLKNKKILLTGFTLCTFVLGSIPAAAAVDFEEKFNIPYAVNSIYALLSVLTFLPKIDDPGLKGVRYAGLLGVALGMTYFYYQFGGQN